MQWRVDLLLNTEAKKCNNDRDDSTAWAAYIAIALVAPFGTMPAACAASIAIDYARSFQDLSSSKSSHDIAFSVLHYTASELTSNFPALYKAYLYFSPAPCCIYKRPGQPINQSVLHLCPSPLASLPPSMAAESSS
jgi:hypothetical protein